jgi:hypothetical protein
LLGKLNDPFGYYGHCGIIAIDQTPLTQRFFERHPKHSDSLGPKASCSSSTGTQIGVSIV